MGRVHSAPVTPKQNAAAQFSRERAFVQSLREGRLLRDRLEACWQVPVRATLAILPVELASRLATRLAKRPSAEDAALAMEGAKVAFPDWGAPQRAEMLAMAVGRRAAVTAELLHRRDFAGPSNPRLVVNGIRQVRAAQALDSGVLFVGGHFANPELYDVALAGLGLAGLRIVDAPSNPYLVTGVMRARSVHGLNEQIGHGDGVFLRARAALRAGGAVQMLADGVPRRGLAVPFFGRLTSTNVLPARLARETGAPIVLMRMRRTGQARYVLTFLPPRRVEFDDREDEVLTWINTFFADEICAAPEDWWWDVARWRDVLNPAPVPPLVTPEMPDQ